MKRIRRKLHWISVFLMLSIILQSCSVYHSQTATIDQAIQSADRVKIISPTNDAYKFKRIEKINEEIYGISKRKSFTAKELNSQIIPKHSDQKNVGILLIDHNISSIHLKNKSASTIITIAIPIVMIGTIIGIGYAAADNVSIDMDWGN